MGDETGVQNELMELESERITISETLERWKEGRSEILEACSQFSNISERLQESRVIPLYDPRHSLAKFIIDLKL